MFAQSATRVLVADPSFTVRSGLRVFLESEPHLEFAGDVSDAPWLLWALQVVEPDMVVVDCALPGGDLQRIVECVRRQRPSTRIVVLGSAWQKASSIEAGADSFVAKTESPDVLRAALLVMADRQN